ncbi:hypothetical protein U1Q18_047854 [Sarracenia purpurea var. burkii]
MLAITSSLILPSMMALASVSSCGSTVYAGGVGIVTVWVPGPVTDTEVSPDGPVTDAPALPDPDTVAVTTSPDVDDDDELEESALKKKMSHW